MIRLPGKNLTHYFPLNGQTLWIYGKAPADIPGFYEEWVYPRRVYKQRGACRVYVERGLVETDAELEELLGSGMGMIATEEFVLTQTTAARELGMRTGKSVSIRRNALAIKRALIRIWSEPAKNWDAECFRRSDEPAFVYEWVVSGCNTRDSGPSRYVEIGTTRPLGCPLI